MDQNIYETIQDEVMLCINCISSIKNEKDKKDQQDITYNNDRYQYDITIIIVNKGSITVPIASVTNIDGKPILNHLLKLIL